MVELFAAFNRLVATCNAHAGPAAAAAAPADIGDAAEDVPALAAGVVTGA